MRQIGREALTYTIMSTGLNCPRAMKYRFEQGLERRVRREALVIGSAFHEGLEASSPTAAARYLGNHTDLWGENEADDLRKTQATVYGMVKGALEHWGTVDQWTERNQEIKFDLPLINPSTGWPSRSFTLRGKIDEVSRDSRGKWWLVEYKTASQMPAYSYVDRLYLDTQVTTYFYAAQRYLGIELAGILYRVVRKPSIRQTKKETVDDYCKRVIKDYAKRPEFYFYEEQMIRSQGDLKEFEQRLWNISQLFLFYRRNNIWPMNTSRCAEWGGCDYIPLCRREEDADLLYVKRESRTPELEG